MSGIDDEIRTQVWDGFTIELTRDQADWLLRLIGGKMHALACGEFPSVKRQVEFDKAKAIHTKMREKLAQ